MESDPKYKRYLPGSFKSALVRVDFAQNRVVKKKRKLDILIRLAGRESDLKYNGYLTGSFKSALVRVDFARTRVILRKNRIFVFFIPFYSARC